MLLAGVTTLMVVSFIQVSNKADEHVWFAGGWGSRE